MDQLVNVLLAIDKVHTEPQKALDCGQGLGRLTRFIGPTIPFPLLRVSIAYITTLPNVQLEISFIP